MKWFIVRRLLYGLVVLWLASIVVFLALRITPGDTTTFVENPIMTPQRMAEIRHQLGLDLPLIDQYLSLMGGMLRGDFGQSAVSHQSISTILAQAAPYTISLATAAALLVYGIGIPMGVVAALRRNRWPDRLAAGIAVVGMGIPNFVLALVLVMVLALGLHLLPVSGAASPTAIVMPAFVLAIEPLAATMRVMRSSVLDQLGRDYVRALSAKGLPRWRIVWLHVVRNSIGPVIALASTQLRSLLGYTLIVEAIFRWPGLGTQLVNSVLTRDYYPAQVFSLMLTTVVILSSILADVLQVALQPSLRHLVEGSGR